jgi:alpha-galactosidase
MATLLVASIALDNGLGLTPAMGYSSWNDCGSSVNESWTKRTAQYFVDSGLAAKGYVHINVDEGWLIGRDAQTLEPIEDRSLFPSGMKGLGEWIHALRVPDRGTIMKYGLYTTRGVSQCSRPEYRQRCLHTPPNPPACTGPHPNATCGCSGSKGYEATDGQWMVAAGADYIKQDSSRLDPPRAASSTAAPTTAAPTTQDSCGVPDHGQDHATAFADYARMRDVLNATGRPVYFSLCGWNEWYAPQGAGLGNSWRIHGDGKDWVALSGAVNTMARIAAYTGPGGWNDPDLLIGPWCGIDHNRSFCGQSDRQARTQFSLWSLFPAPLLISQNVFAWSVFALDTYSNAEAIALNQEPNARAARRLAGGDLLGPSAPCPAANCTNVWGRSLRSPAGAVALAMVNNGAGAANVTCDARCFGDLLDPSRAYAVRDLWAHAALPQLAGGGALTLDVPGDGGCRLVTLSPALETR